jgi:preprotein translocase subunit YajC
MHAASLSLLAAAAATQGPPAWVQFLPLVAMGVVFWLLILRPQMKKQKDHQTKIETIKKGDQVLTGGGIVGKVVRVDEHYADVEIAQGIKVKVLKSTISDLIPPTGSAPAND